jgi:hypothetical protein
MDYKTIQRPYLIQRGNFRDIPEDQIKGLDSLIHYDYMGSSEFECGALPKALKLMTANWGDYVHFQMDSIKDSDGQYLQVLCQKSQVEEVKDVLTQLFSKDCQIRLKEFTGMYDYISCKSIYSLKTNFWWDVTGNDYHDRNPSNSWMCCFGNNIRSLIIAISKVWCKHNPEGILLDYGPAIPNSITKPKPSQLIIDSSSLKQITVTIPSSGRKIVINKRSIEDVQIFPDRIEVTVKNKTGKLRVLIIEEESNSTRIVLENMLLELKYVADYLKRSAK